MGASTGRDGIGGASVLASAELDEADESKRPSVQIGDPFEESKLVECCLELLDAGLLVSLQDLGAAGLTSSAAEMASGGGVGIDIDVGRVPLREADMEPFEIMVSESQERMLAVVEPAKVDEVLAICRKWQAAPAVVGEVTDSGLFRVLRGDEVTGEMPVEALVDGCPLYDLEPEEPERLDLRQRANARGRRPGRDPPRAPRLALHRFEEVGVRAVRLDRRLAHRPPPRDGRRRRPPASRDGQRDRDLDRRQRPPGRVRPLSRRRRGGARMRSEPRLRRRGAARPHELPQLRQPREARRRLAARPRRAGPGRRVQRDGRAGRRRQRLALQRDGPRPDLPHSGRRARRRASGPAKGRRAGAFRRRRDRAGRAVRPVARGIGARRSSAASSSRAWPRSTSTRTSARSRSSAKKRAPETLRSTTSPTAASPARSPRWRSPAVSARGVTWTPWSAPAAPSPRRPSSAKGRAAT